MAWRHEEKYVLPLLEAQQIMRRVANVMRPDTHYANGEYVIQSLYFDDYRFSAMEEKAAGLAEHTKFRIRTYNADPSRISLERKVKKGILTQKKSALIDAETCAAIVMGELPHDCDERTKALWDQMHLRALRPACVVRYKRRAFTYSPLNIRITFDTQIEYLPADMFTLMEHEIRRGTPALASGQVIMEVKYDDYLPVVVRSLTMTQDLQTSFSKYAVCMMKSGRILTE